MFFSIIKERLLVEVNVALIITMFGTDLQESFAQIVFAKMFVCDVNGSYLWFARGVF